MRRKTKKALSRNVKESMKEYLDPSYPDPYQKLTGLFWA